MTCGHAPGVCRFLLDAGRQTCAACARVWSGSHLPSVLPWLRLVKASISLPRGPRGFETPAPSHNTWDGGSAMPCRGFCRASPLPSSAQTSGPFLSILWFGSSLVSCLDCSSPWAMCPHVPVLSLRLFSPRKALQLWVSVWAAMAVYQVEASLKASGACLPPPSFLSACTSLSTSHHRALLALLLGGAHAVSAGSAPLPSGYHLAVLILRKRLRAGSSEPLLWWTPSCPPISGHHFYEEVACTFCVYVCQRLTLGCPASLLLFPEFECSRSFQNLRRKEAPSPSPFSSPALQLGSRQLLCSASTATWPLIWPGLQGPLCIPVRPLHHIQ